MHGRFCESTSCKMYYIFLTFACRTSEVKKLYIQMNVFNKFQKPVILNVNHLQS